MSKTLLLTIDFINDLVHPDGKFASVANYVEEMKVIENANKALAIATEKDYMVAHAKIGFTPSFVECPKRSPFFGAIRNSGALILDTWGCEFHEDLDVHEHDKVIVKHRISALYGTDLSIVLNANKIEHVILCGVSTNMSIESTARELHDMDYRITIIGDACGAVNDKTHQASLITMSRLVSICTADDL